MGDKSKTYFGPGAAAKYSAEQEKREIEESKHRSDEQNRAYRTSKKCHAARADVLRILNDWLESRGSLAPPFETLRLTLAGAINALTESGEVLDRIATAPNGGAEKLRLDLAKANEEIVTLKQTVSYLEEQAMPDHHLR